MKIIQISGKMASGKTTLCTKLFDHYSRKGLRIYKTSFANPLKNFLSLCGIIKNYNNIMTNNSSNNNKKFSNFNNFYIFFISNIYDNFSKMFKNIYDEFAYVDLITTLFENCNKYKNKLKHAFDEYFINNNYSTGFRLFAQIFGTEICRNFDNDIWVKIIENYILNIYNFTDIILIDDWRFKNEDLKYLENKINNCKVVKIKIKCDDHLRAKSLGISFSELIKKSNHRSEKEVDELNVDLVVERLENGNYNPSFNELVRLIERI